MYAYKQKDIAMKVKFDIECTPQEARAFFGLPDVEPMQAAMMKELEAWPHRLVGLVWRWSGFPGRRHGVAPSY